MEMVKIVKNGIEYFCIYQRQGNDKNGNPLYLVNIFQEYETTEKRYYCMNSQTQRRLDKYGNIKITSYNILDDINHILQNL